jgi:hypothetical protein
MISWGFLLMCWGLLGGAWGITAAPEITPPWSLFASGFLLWAGCGLIEAGIKKAVRER